MKQLRVASTGTYRTEEYQGRTWTVVPVVALVETVVHAMNADTPELVTAESYSKHPGGWNGRPVFIGHPTVNGTPVTGNSPEILEKYSVGMVFNAELKDGKLVMEAWLDNSRADDVPELKVMLERIANGDPIEISVGAFVETDDDATGLFNGKQYQGAWVDVTPDHLALLPEGDQGACSRDAGCGVRAASAKKGVTMTEQKGIIARVLSTIRTLMNPSEMSDNDIRRKIAEALQKADPRAYYPDAYYAEQNTFVYSVYTDGGVKYFKRGYSLGEDGNVTLAGDPKEVEPVLRYEDVGTSSEEVTAAQQAAPAACGTCAQKTSCPCKTPASLSQETNMKREDLITKLEGVADDKIESFLSSLETPASTPAAPAQEAAASPTAAAQAPAVTFESLLAAAPADVREGIESQMRAARERKAASIKTLRDSGRCDLSDEILNAKSQSELDALVKLAGVTVEAPRNIDFSALGQARTPEVAQKEAPAAPNLQDRILAARK